MASLQQGGGEASRRQQGALDKGGGTVTDEAADDGLVQGLSVELLQGGVDGRREVGAGVDEGAVKVEDQQGNLPALERGDHCPRPMVHSRARSSMGSSSGPL